MMTHYPTRLLVALLVALALFAGGCSAATPAPEPLTISLDEPLELGPNIDAETLAAIKDRTDVVVLDVREPHEYADGHIPGVVHIPMNDVPARMSEIPTDGTVIVSCRSGNRSSQITGYLRDQGYTNVHNLDGGIVGWQSAGLPVEE